MPMGTMCEELGRPAGGRGLPFIWWLTRGGREGGEEAGGRLGPSHWPRGKRGNWAPLGATGGSGPERQRGNLAKPGAFSA